MHNSNWDDLRFVLAVAEAGSVNAATTRLGVNHATVLRRVSAFEQRYGTQVFIRNATGYAVDPSCLPVIEALQGVSRAVDGVERALASTDLLVSGPIRLTTTDTLALTVLPDIMCDLDRRFPGLHVEIDVTNTRRDLSRLDAELTLRPAVALPEDLRGTRVCSMGFAVYGAVDLADEPAQSRRWIGGAGPLSNAPVAQWVEDRADGTTICKATSFPAMAALASAGVGWAMLPCCLGDRTRGLRRSKRIPDRLDTGVWVAWHVDMAEVPRIARTRDLLIEHLAAQAAMLEGLPS